LERAQTQSVGEDYDEPEAKNGEDPGIQKLEFISQELYFKISFMKQLFIEGDKGNGNLDFNQFYNKSQSNISDALLETVNSPTCLREIIQGIQEIPINQRNIKLLERKRRLLVSLRILLMKWDILSLIKESISRGVLANEFPEMIIENIKQITENLKEEDEILALIGLIKKLLGASLEIENMSIYGPDIISSLMNLLWEQVQKLPKVFKVDSEGYIGFRRLHLRNELYKKLKEKSLLISGDISLETKGYEKEDEIESYDYQEIFFGKSEFLLKYLLVLRDKEFLGMFCQAWGISKEIQAQCLTLIDFAGGRQGGDQVQGPLPELLMLEKVLLGGFGEAMRSKEMNGLLSCEVFRDFPELQKLEVCCWDGSLFLNC